MPPTLVINLDSRPDKMIQTKEEFSYWPSPLERIAAIQYSPGWKGCAASHLKSIRLAKERDYPWVIIIEDDCILMPGAQAQLQALLPYLWETRERWDIFYGGTTFLTYQSRIETTPPIYEVRGFTTHFCLIHKGTYDTILNNQPKDVSKIKIPIDVYYSEQLRIWTTTPFFAKQRPGKSDINKSLDVDYNSGFDTAEQLLLS
jgi:hypothetical protein